jgi:chromate transporter
MASASDPRTPSSGEVGVLVRHVPLWDLFTVFLKVSVRGWGGGTGTVYVMHRELVRRGWITSGQFAVDWGLSRLAPGINLFAVAVMIGYRLNGPLGSIVSAIGFMLPASIITIVLTMAFAEITSNPIGASLVKGAVPVTAALTFSLAYELAAETAPWPERRITAMMGVGVLLCFGLVVVFQVPVAIMIIAGAVLGGFFLQPRTQPRGQPRGRSKPA